MNRQRLRDKSMKQANCNNCGEHGHIYKDCKSPTTSYGILAYYKDKDNILHYLEVNRKFSISFCEFVRGNYNTKKKGFSFPYLQHLFRNMTMVEKKLVEEETFQVLWDTMCSNTVEQKRHFIYKRSKQKYSRLEDGVRVELARHKSILVTIKSMLKKNTTTYHSPEWGFPKGRKNKNETGLECALREFTEETSIDNKKLVVLFKDPIVEEYMGSNGCVFCNKYYIARLEKNNNNDLETQTSDYIRKHGSKIQNVEIGRVQWLDYYQGSDNIRDYHRKTKEILYHVHHYLLSFHNLHSFISSPFGVPNIISNIDYSFGYKPL
jgi:8-oxo-dGTP pyrophosphatase MutT (NUDIX family)